ncbi:restriction endonuclease subunit S [Campylobacter helveticus]|uniref:restriction endonuclease subunit S n=1 Tax=Campylobacter helveticus TaxID=28898 RepID=UPI0022EB9872|nr:restriction endonuclease subunit S [Campylobacter helveticus]
MLDSIQELESKLDFDNNNTLDFKTLLDSIPTPPPQGWERVRLGKIEHIQIQKGQSITQKDTQVGNIKVVAGGLDFAYFHNQANRPENTITISASGANAGFVNFWEEAIFASDCTTININSKVKIKFIYYTLRAMQNDIKALAKGAAQPHVYRDDIEQIKIPLPPLAAQENIIQTIEKLEMRIENFELLMENLESKKAEILTSFLESGI